MIVVATWALIGSILMFTLVNDADFIRLGLLDNWFERFVFVWAWPAFLFVFSIWRFCRADDDPGRAVL